jgi:hypothetical protein
MTFLYIRRIKTPLKMKNYVKNQILLTLLGIALAATSCDDSNADPSPNAAVYEQEDQMGRPAINTVFVTSGEKDLFNTTPPAQQAAMFATKFQDKLLALNSGYTTNLLGLDASTFSNVLANDVLTVSLTDPTTFYDGTNVLTGRRLDDNVITVELILIFGGPDAMANPGLTDDHVDANDKPFSDAFPYLATPH